MIDDLLATCWTHAGPVSASDSDQRSPWSLADRFAACAQAGFAGIDLLLADLRQADATVGLPHVRALLDDAGLTFVQLELLGEWWADGDQRVASDADRALLLRAAEVLGARQLKVSADLSDRPVPAEAMTSHFARLARQAADSGVQLAIEPLPFSNLPTIEAGARFVREAGHANGGVCVDLWHVHRGGSTLESLRAELDPEHLFAVELCDGTEEVPAGKSLPEDADDDRLLPGQGEWDVPGFIRTVRDLGYAGPWGVEICSEDFRRLPLVEAVTSAARASTEVLAAAGRDTAA